MIPDVLIIGAGAIGLSIANTLLIQGLRVKLLDIGKPGKGASWASAGVLAPQGAHQMPGPYLDLVLKSRDMFGALAEQLKEDSGVDIEYRSEGGLHIALNDEEADILEARYQHQKGLGLPIEPMTPEEVLSLEPALSPNIRSGLFFTGMHQVENRRLVEALTVAVGRKGGTFVSGAPVTALTIRKERLISVESARDSYKAGMVVNAAGAWSRLIGEDGLTAPPVNPVKGQMLALDVGTTTPIRHVIHGCSQYLVPRSDGRLIAGATVEKVGYDTQVTAGGLSTILHNAIQMAPSLETAPVAETWAGLRPMSKDGKPILGPTSISGLIMATGHHRNGILLTPVTARLIAEYISDGNIPSEMQPFLLERFSKKS